MSKHMKSFRLILALVTYINTSIASIQQKEEVMFRPYCLTGISFIDLGIMKTLAECEIRGEDTQHSTKNYAFSINDQPDHD